MKLLLTLLGIGQTLWSILGPVLKKETGTLLEQILPIATQVVTELIDKRDLPNAKRDAAVAQIRDLTRQAGLSASTSLINLAIEMAVQALKHK